MTTVVGCMPTHTTYCRCHIIMHQAPHGPFINIYPYNLHYYSKRNIEYVSYWAVTWLLIFINRICRVSHDCVVIIMSILICKYVLIQKCIHDLVPMYTWMQVHAMVAMRLLQAKLVLHAICCLSGLLMFCFSSMQVEQTSKYPSRSVQLGISSCMHMVCIMW